MSEVDFSEETPNFDQSHELFIYENTDLKYEVTCQLNRRHHSACLLYTSDAADE